MLYSRTVSTLLNGCGTLRFTRLSERSRHFSTEIFVTRLSSYTTEEEFNATFSPFGDIEEARLIRDKITQRPKGYGFVRYKSEVEAQRAMKAMDGRILAGRLIFVEIARSRPEPPYPGSDSLFASTN